MIAQQKPPTKLVTYMVLVSVANTVHIQERDSGGADAKRTVRRPNFIARPPNRAPKKAPPGGEKRELRVHFSGLLGKPTQRLRCKSKQP
ncbi:hypothetical protein M8J77_016694 [Diaphorina citri]|jgi:hypothetical protein|nr:hypothetical protein M8J77_016694 [Diaphorina citri]